MRILQTVFILSLLLTSLFSFAGDARPGSIKGTIKLNDGKPAAYVSVLVKSIGRGAVTEENGSFSLRNIAPGTYTLEVSLTGYESTTQSVTIAEDATAEVSITLNVSSGQLAEVVVKTGRNSYKSNTPSNSLRLNEPLNEVPQNIQVVTDKLLSDQQVISMSDGVVRNISGAIRNEHWGDLYANITVRGSQIQAFRNGFNVVNSYWGPLTEDMSFVDHIEFVKGPASFMLANGDPSGLYNVVTKKPTSVNKGEVEMTTGSFGLYRATLDLDGKLSTDGKLLYRINLMGQNKGSFRPNEFNNRYSIAPVLSYQVDDKTKITLEYDLQHAKMSDVGSYYAFSPYGFATLPRDYTQLPAGMPATTIDDNSAFLTVQHQLSNNWKLTAQGAYFYYSQVGTSMWPSVVNADNTIQRSVSSWDAKSFMKLAQVFVNGEANTGSIHHRILGGLDIGSKNYYADWGQYHLLDTAAISIPASSGAAPSNGFPDFDNDKSTLTQRAQKVGGLQDLNYTSLYVQDELGFLNNIIRLTLAGRYTKVNQSAFGGTAQKAQHFTPRAGISVSVDKSTSVYGVFDQAFTPQSGVLRDGSTTPAPLTGSNLEFGIKKDWANGNWTTTLDVYRILKNNELISDPTDTQHIKMIVLGKKRAQGIEFDLCGQIVRGLNLVANYALTDSKVIEVSKDVTSLKVGDPLPSYAKHTANAWLIYTIPAGALKGFGASAGATALAGRESYWDPSPDPNIKIPDYIKADGGLFWEGSNLRITANVFNVFNKFTYSGSYYSYLQAYYWQADAPRNIRFSVSYKF